MKLGANILNQRQRAAALWLSTAIGAIVLIALLLSLRLTAVAAPTATTWYVHPNGSDSDSGTLDLPFKTIQHAIDKAEGGDTILVAAGAYTENVIITKTLTLHGGHTVSGTAWLPRTGETIMDGSNSRTVGDWDSWVMQSAVISDSTEYKMWFDGMNLLNKIQVGLATSSDGISWTKYPANPVLTGTAGAWDESGEHGPFVLKEDGVYKMWYEGNNGNVRQLGYATSTNGIYWNKYPGNPVLEAGPEGFDQDTAGHGSVLNDRGTYKLWYYAGGDQGAIIAYATSPDGINWTKQGPVLKPASAGSWDDKALSGPSVLKLNSTYWMWYAAGGSQEFSAIGVVTSTDGITWTRFLAASVVTETGPVG
ncbi:MAG: DUF1565 domain-containing protein, partial [Chloroflexi bacterium]|nr:DUF1565 domain-containing protein [Chloroflexota bacterium]